MWLAMADQSDSLYSLKSVPSLAFMLMMHHPFRFTKLFLKNYLFGKFKTNITGHLARTMFSLHATRNLSYYYCLFSDIAREYNAWVVAGTSVIPKIEMLKSGGVKVIDENSLYNSALSFDPYGYLINVTHKSYLVDEEKSFINASNGEVSSFATDLGQVSVLVCADSWYPKAYESLTKLPVPPDIICCSSWVEHSEMNDKWHGYNGHPTPHDVNKSHIGTLTESEAWDKYAVIERFKTVPKALWSVCCFFRGCIFGMILGGKSAIASRHQGVEYETEDKDYFIKAIEIHK